VQRFDFWIAVAAVIATVLVGVLAGVVVGVALSLVWLISVATRPAIPQLARQSGTQVFRELAQYPNDEQIPGVVVLRMDGGLYFATADAIEDRVREFLGSGTPLDCIVLDFGGIDFIDSQGSGKLNEIAQFAADSTVRLRLAGVKPVVAAVLERDGVIDRIGRDRMHGNVFRAVVAQLADIPPDATSPRDG
jgi:SulP family sulfate permease